MILRKAATFKERGLSLPISILGRLGGIIIAVMMFLTVADFLGRRFFKQPIAGTVELCELMLLLVVFFTITQCEFLRGHVTIDLVVARLRRRAQDTIDSAMYFLYLATFCLLTWRLWLHAISLWQKGLVTAVLHVPVFPFVIVATLGSALLSLVVLTHFFLYLAGAMKR